MNSAPTQPALTTAWLLVAVLLSVAVALVAVLLKVTQGERVSATLPSAAVAFAGTMALCLPSFTAAGLL